MAPRTQIHETDRPTAGPRHNWSPAKSLKAKVLAGLAGLGSLMRPSEKTQAWVEEQAAQARRSANEAAQQRVEASGGARSPGNYNAGFQ